MTPEEKIADLKANFDYVLEGKDLEIKQLGERCNQLLKDKGDLTDELAKWKEEWQEQVQKATDEGWERTKLTGRVRELEKQIEKLKKYIKACWIEENLNDYSSYITNSSDEFKDLVHELNEEIRGNRK